MTPTRVLLVDDDALVRGALRMMLEGQSDLRVVAEDLLGRLGQRGVELGGEDVPARAHTGAQPGGADAAAGAELGEHAGNGLRDLLRIGRIHAPIGLDIGSKAPAEIALSTLAGLLADRNGRSGGTVHGAAAAQG